METCVGRKLSSNWPICQNVMSYIRTRFLVLLNKPTQDATAKVLSKTSASHGQTKSFIKNMAIDFMIRPMPNSKER